MSKNAIELRLGKATMAIDALQKQWELFFTGQRKLPPQKEKSQLEREMRALRNLQIHDSSLRFRMLNLQNRFNVYMEMWNRRMRELEEGPIHFKRRKAVIQKIQEKSDTIPSEDESSGRHVALTERNGAAKSVVVHDPLVEEDQMKTLYDQYVAAKKEAGNSDVVTFDGFANRLSQQIISVERKRRCAAVTVRIDRDPEGKVKVKFKAVKESQ